jgi:Cu/Ag efflux pump CusA
LNVGGDVIEKNGQAYVVRGIGLVKSVADIGNITIRTTAETRFWLKMLRKYTKVRCLE